MKFKKYTLGTPMEAYEIFMHVLKPHNVNLLARYLNTALPTEVYDFQGNSLVILCDYFIHPIYKDGYLRVTRL